jgi:hypothetical protein
MKKAKCAFVLCTLLLMPCAAFSEDAQDMMGQYKAMSEGTSKNFPKELEVLMPKDFKIESKGFIFKETANMLLFAALSGSRKNDVYKKFGHDGRIEIGIMAYNPASSNAYVMAAQMPTMYDYAKKDWAKGIINESGWELSPVTVSKINQADVFIQKGIRKKVDIDDFKTEDQVYYCAKAVLVRKNACLTIDIINYPLKGENVSAAIRDITRLFLATNWNKYMK